jgi:hypothetical protein
MMTRDVMVGLVCEMYEVADKISKAERALDDYENGSSFMSDQAAELLRKQVVAMKAYHDIVAARISHQTREAAHGTEF